MTVIYQCEMSCGVKQIAQIRGLRRNERRFREFVNYEVSMHANGDHPGNMVFLFSDVDKFRNGEWFAKMIRKYRLGKVTRAVKANKNPGSGNLISVYTWVYNCRAAELPGARTRKVS